MIFIANFFQAIFEHEFIRYALFAGLIVGILAPLIGSIVVIRRLSLIADTLSHFSLAGVCLGVILSELIQTPFVSPAFMGVIFSIIATLMIEKLRTFYENYKEISMPIIMSLGLALSGLFINLSSNLTSAQTTSLLYGSILTISLSDIILITITGVIILTFGALYYKQIVTMCFDEFYASVRGINTKFIRFMLTIVLAIVISLFIDIVGVLLIASLMILPVASAILIGDSFLNTILISIFISEISFVGGLVIGYQFSLSTGPVIILINLFIYVLILSLRKVKSNHLPLKKENT